MKKLLVVLLFCLCSCQTGMIRVKAIDPLVRVVADRHDMYVRKDESLTEEQKQTYLRSTILLRKVLHEAQRRER